MRIAVIVSVLSLGAVASCADEELVEVPEPEPEPEVEREVDTGEPPANSGDECSDDSDCGPGSECDAGVCVGVGVLQITLTFSVDADYDLHVFTPSGDEIYWDNPVAGGGVLDVDQCIAECGAGTHIENVFFEDDVPSGLYFAWVENYDGRDGGSFRIEVSGAANTFLEGSLLAFPGELSQELSFSIED